jgi:rubrerythrin
MADSHILLYRAYDRTEAHFLQHVLESAGIRAHLAGGTSPILFGELGAGEALNTDIWVERDAVERARRLIEAQLEHRTQAEAAEDPWTCAACGEPVSGDLDACWSCGAQRS